MLSIVVLFCLIRALPSSTLFPYTTLFRSTSSCMAKRSCSMIANQNDAMAMPPTVKNRSTWSSHVLRSEEHTSELQSHSDLVCRLLLEKKKNMTNGNEQPRKTRQLVVSTGI